MAATKKGQAAEVACPTCGAAPGKVCVSKTGRPSPTMHAPRLAAMKQLAAMKDRMSAGDETDPRVTTAEVQPIDYRDAPLVKSMQAHAEMLRARATALDEAVTALTA